MISTGVSAPDFTLPDESGNRVSLSSFKGKPVLLLFYPGDETPVCTKELCSYRDNFGDLTARGLTLLGISTDSAASHQKFKAKHHFPFALLSDSEKKVSRLYDALSILGVSQRAYVLIDAAGVIKLSFSEALPIFYHTSGDLLKKIDAVLPRTGTASQPA
ncbi:MAG: peroxiredoxin [Rhizobacter sp.]|nr:peroxiredoxin [Chlorobiales bacterium]